MNYNKTYMEMQSMIRHRFLSLDTDITYEIANRLVHAYKQGKADQLKIGSTEWERRPGATLVKKIPMGWSIRFVGETVIAIHPKQFPRTCPLIDIVRLSFDDWEEL